MNVELRLLRPDDAGVLDRIADGVFDCAVDPALKREFLDDPRHHIYVAIADGVVVGMISALHYVHPDKPAQLWINEVGVAASHHRQGIGTQLLAAMLEHGRSLGCTEAWLGTEEDNLAARRLYARVATSAEPFILYSFDLRNPSAAPDASAGYVESSAYGDPTSSRPA